MYAIYKSPTSLAASRALLLSHTVHRIGHDPVPVAVVMLHTPRLTDRHYRQTGQRALYTLAALGVNVGDTDPLAFARRFAGPVTDLTLTPTHAIDQDTGIGRTHVTYFHNRGGGALPGTMDVLNSDGSPIVLPAIDYTHPTN